jgi:2-amino-4-hydroxy-6-hydroxymethyldihydropteridine diphosphokinase
VPTAQAVSLAYVGLGSNLGSSIEALRQALQAIRALPETHLEAVSSPYRTAPLEASGPDFINAVAALRTRLAPEVLLRHLLSIEQAHGRERPYRNAPRTLDLDLLLYGNCVLNTPSLILPHPRLHQRQFVLVPLLELDPQLQIAGLGALRDLSIPLNDQTIERLDESLLP